MEKQYAAHKARENEHRQQQIIAGKKQSSINITHSKLFILYMGIQDYISSDELFDYRLPTL